MAFGSDPLVSGAHHRRFPFFMNITDLNTNRIISLVYQNLVSLFFIIIYVYLPFFF